MFTKRHYIAIAKIVSSLSRDGRIDTSQLILRLSVLFREDNPLFNRDKFTRACMEESNGPS